MRSKRVSDEALLMIIDDARLVNGYAPSYRELSRHTGMVLSAIGYRIAQLRKEGLLEQVSTSSARTLVLSDAGRRAIGRSAVSQEYKGVL